VILRDAVPLAARRPGSAHSEAVLAVARADVALLADAVAVIQRLPAPAVRRDPLIDVGPCLARGERTVLDVLHDQDCLRENHVVARLTEFGWDNLLDMRFGALVLDDPDEDDDAVAGAGGLADVRIDADGQLVTDDPRTARIFSRDRWGAPQELDESTWEERSDDLLDEFGVPDARHDDLEYVESVGPRRLVKRSTHVKAPLRGVHPDRPWAPTSTLRRAKDGLVFVDEAEPEHPSFEQARRAYFEMLDEALEQDAWEAGYEAGEAAEELLDEGVLPGWVDGERSAVLAPEHQLAWDLQPDGVLHGRQPDVTIRSVDPWALKPYTRSRRAHQRAGASVAAVAFSTPLYAAADRASRVPPSSPLGELFYALRCGDIDLLSGRSPFRPTRWTYR
jgi:hypothetical protein